MHRSVGRRLLAVALVATPLWLAAATSSSAAPAEINHRIMPIRGGQATPAGNAGGKVRGANGINYNGGPVMTNPTTAYIIWYGDWAASPALRQTIITDFLSNVGGSPYYNINSTYTNGAGAKVSTSVTLGTQVNDLNSQGTSNLSDAQIQAIVNKAITGGALPTNANAVYFVLTAANVSKQGFLTSYCGWHTKAAINGATVKYSFVGDPTAGMSSCAGQTVGPNGDAPGDAMVSVIAHELEEAATDPELNAWYDSRGYENADKCAWTWGTTYTVANGAKANMKLGTRDYLIQRNWVNASGGYCSLSY